MQDCNPNALTFTVPSDSFILTLVAPLVVQKFFTGASKRAVFVAWTISIVLVYIALQTVGSTYDQYIWVGGQFVLFLCISYEIERGFISRFIGKKHETAASDNNLRLIMELEQAKRVAIESDMSSKLAMIRYICDKMKNPSNIIAASVEALLLELETIRDNINPELFEIIVTCRESCTVSREIVSDLMSFEKLTAGAYQVECSPVAVLSFVLEVARPFVLNARAKGIDLKFEKFNCNDRASVNIDPVKMGQVGDG